MVSNSDFTIVMMTLAQDLFFYVTICVLLYHFTFRSGNEKKTALYVKTRNGLTKLSTLNNFQQFSRALTSLRIVYLVDHQFVTNAFTEKKLTLTKSSSKGIVHAIFKFERYKPADGNSLAFNMILPIQYMYLWCFKEFNNAVVEIDVNVVTFVITVVYDELISPSPG